MASEEAAAALDDIIFLGDAPIIMNGRTVSHHYIIDVYILDYNYGTTYLSHV